MEGNIAATYTLIYRFLKQQSQHKAAEAVKKAAKAAVVLRDDVGHEGPPLEDIIREWKAKGDSQSKTVDPSSESSDSSDDTSSDSSDSASGDSDSSSEDVSGSKCEGDDTSDDSDRVTVAKRVPQKAVERDTSATLSSAGENAREAVKQYVQMLEKTSPQDAEDSESDSSESDSSSNNSDAVSSSTSSSSSGSSDSSDEDDADTKVPSSRTKTTKDESPSASESSSASQDEPDSKTQQKEDTRVAKKRKTTEDGSAVTTAVATGSQQTAKSLRKKDQPPPKGKERFQRVKVPSSDVLLNNNYEARGGVANDYGERAHRDLVITRGAGFRKEKNKKKRGSYRGGEITMECHSIKFDF